MNPDIKELWAQALESGEFKQGIGVLHRSAGPDEESDTYCCLGVLCELAYRAGVVERSANFTDTPVYAYGSREEYSILPREVMAWAELEDNDPVVPASPPLLSTDSNGRDKVSTNLVDANDTFKLPFPVIAEMIRASDI